MYSTAADIRYVQTLVIWDKPAQKTGDKILVQKPVPTTVCVRVLLCVSHVCVRVHVCVCVRRVLSDMVSLNNMFPTHDSDTTQLRSVKPTGGCERASELWIPKYLYPANLW